MSRKVDYFISEQLAPDSSDCVLVGLPVRYIPALLRGQSQYLGRALWASDTDWATGYQGTALMMESLLMDCGEFIINNIIALRGIDPLAPRDDATGVPINPPTGSTLRDLYDTFQSGGVSPGARLATIDTSTAQTAQATQQGLLTETGDDALLGLLLGLI
jgi:hypothetical protein